MNMNPLGSSMVSLASIFMFHFGGKHLVFDLTPGQRALFKHPIMQALILTSMFFMSTRNIQFSLILVIVYFVAIYVLFNEFHPMNIITRIVNLDRLLESNRPENVEKRMKRASKEEETKTETLMRTV